MPYLLRGPVLPGGLHPLLRCLPSTAHLCWPGRTRFRRSPRRADPAVGAAGMCWRHSVRWCVRCCWLSRDRERRLVDGRRCGTRRSAPGGAGTFGTSQAARCERGGLAPACPLVLNCSFPRTGFCAVPRRPSRAGRVMGRPGSVAQATVMAEPGPRSPRFPSSKFRAPKVVPGLVRRPGCSTSWTEETRFASPWWWARRGQGRRCSSPIGWQLALSGHRRG